MVHQRGERVYWGAPEIIYLEGIIREFDEAEQTVIVQVDRATPHSAHLIGNSMSFAANGLMPLKGESPAGTTSKRNPMRQSPPQLSDEDKIHRAASVAVHQQHGYTLPVEREQELIATIAQTIQADPAMRTRIITSIDEILRREL